MSTYIDHYDNGIAVLPAHKERDVADLEYSVGECLETEGRLIIDLSEINTEMKYRFAEDLIEFTIHNMFADEGKIIQIVDPNKVFSLWLEKACISWKIHSNLEEAFADLKSVSKDSCGCKENGVCNCVSGGVCHCQK